MQLLCVDTLILLAKYNGDLMWLIMIQLIPEQLPYYTPLTCKTIKVLIFTCKWIIIVIVIIVIVAIMCDGRTSSGTNKNNFNSM